MLAQIENKKMIKILTVIIMCLLPVLFLFILFILIPSGFIPYSYQNGFAVEALVHKSVLFQYKYIFISLFVALSVILFFLSKYLHNDFKEAEKIAFKDIYKKSDLHKEVPTIIWIGIAGLILLLILLYWLFVR